MLSSSLGKSSLSLSSTNSPISFKPSTLLAIELPSPSTCFETPSPRYNLLNTINDIHAIFAVVNASQPLAFCVAVEGMFWLDSDAFLSPLFFKFSCILPFLLLALPPDSSGSLASSQLSNFSFTLFFDSSSLLLDSLLRRKFSAHDARFRQNRLCAR
ncbi:hypothetical protein SCHPADRAFT_901496 [Schizopora paradoxa]|uniref:Uncharacterized protein n=1 Tax=Schizopora paradoxa TaxID=27342 RepID=A0A0H2S404_9AGAM|nr:hypothetical protein SCHPADRAFT_901496 [Schizopora paradoxa]